MVLEDEEEDEEEEERFSTITTADVRTARRRKMDIGTKEVKEGPDWLDRSWREKGV